MKTLRGVGVALAVAGILVATATPPGDAVMGEPGCENEVRAGSEDTPLAGALSCAHGALRYRATADPAHGTVNITANGVFTYMPEANFHGLDGFSFEACRPGRHDKPDKPDKRDKPDKPDKLDRPHRCGEGRMQIRVAPVNDAPTADAVSVATDEDTPVEVPFRGFDVDGDPLTYSLASQPAHGTATVAGSGATYTPAANYTGPDSFVYLVLDGNGATGGATVSVAVAPVNDAPAAQDIAATTPEDTPRPVELLATDVEGDPVSYEVVAGPAHGALSGAGAVRTYTPAADYHGADSFTYRASDGAAESEVATVTLTVDPVNDAPTAESFSIATAEDTGKELVLAGADVDGDALTYEIVTGPARGELSGDGASRTYTPTANYHGPDSFTYRVNDGVLASSVAAVDVTVGRLNDAPAVKDLVATTAEDEPKAIFLIGVDPEGDPVSYEIVAPPAHGTLSGAGSERIYTPNTHYFGSDSFRFRASDGSASSNDATVTLTVTEVNDAPVANPDAKSTAEDAALTFPASDLVANDSSGPANESGQTFVVSAVGGPVGGAVMLAGGDVTFTPDADFNGSASFAYTVADDGLTNGAPDSLSASGTVTVAVAPVNDAPALSNDGTSTMSAIAEDAADPAGDSVPAILATGTAGDPISDIDSGALEGIAVTSAAVSNGSWQYSLDGGATWAHPSEPLSGSKALLLAATPETRLRFVPSANFNGAVTLVYRAWDRTSGSSGAVANATENGGTSAFSAQTEEVALTVTPVNDPPVAVSDDYTAAARTGLVVTAPGVLVNDTDVDSGTSLQALEVAPPAHGTLALGTDGSFFYQPTPGYEGRDVFTYKASDGAADSNVATVTIEVGGNSPPVTIDGSATTAEDAATAVTLPASDPDGDELSYAIVVGPGHGTLSGSGADRIYTPEPNYNGDDQLTYKVNDGTVDSNVATIALTVTAVNDPPSASADEKTVAEDTPLRFAATELAANDATGPPNESGQALTVTGVGSPDGGTVELAAGEITFTPAPNFNGAATFSYTVADDGQTDGAADPQSAVGAVTITVTPVNDRPVAHPGSATIKEDESGTIALPASDADGDSLSYEVVSPPNHGSVTAAAGDRVMYTPAPDYSGEDAFAFVASDGSSTSEPGTVSVDVAPVNDAPALDASGNLQLTPVNANASDPAGDTVADILASGAGGGQILRDIDGDAVGIGVTAADGAGGTWQYRLAGEAWSSLDGVTRATARLLGLDSRLRFVPDPGFTGEATVEFRAWDGTAGSLGGTADATVTGGISAFSADGEVATVTVIPNTLPIAVDDRQATEEDTPVTIGVLANDSDADGDPLAVTDMTRPADGTARVVDGQVEYVPHADHNGTDQFTYTVSDGRGGTATAKVAVTVAAVNDVPIARADSEFVAEDGTVVFDPTGNDLAGPLDESGGQLTSPTITGAPQNGTAAITASGADPGWIRYVPNPGFAGSDVLSYEVCDDGTPPLCSEAVVTLTASRVAATVETVAVPFAGDAADDPAIWVHPEDPARSLIIGTVKQGAETATPPEHGGLALYGLDGTQHDYVASGRMNNVDLRRGFRLGGEDVTLVTSTERNRPGSSTRRIWIYKLDPSSRTLSPVHSAVFAAGFEPLGDCMYRSSRSGDFFVFVVGANGMVEQWRLSEAAGGTGLVDATKVRTFLVNETGIGDIAEGCVADDQLGHLYVGEEDVGIWKYSAEPDGGDTRTQVDAVGGGNLTADVEGLTIAYGPGDTGYLIASSQGSSSYAVYRREGDNPFVRSFKIKAGAEIDAVTATDGIDVTSAALGPAFPNGVFVAQDNLNAPDNQNFKLVPLEQIVQTGGLGSNGSCARPYSDSSPWNVPIAAGAASHPESTTHVNTLAGPLTSDPSQFTFPVYVVSQGTPRETVTLTGWFSNVTDAGRTLVNQREGTVELPIPAGAVPAAGGDAQMIMIDPWTGDEWGFSSARRDPATGAWTGWNAYHYNTRWSGVPPYDATGRSFVPRGAGLPYLAGLVRPCELARGRIDHALAFAYDFPTGEYVYPATKSDGDSPGFPDMPEGARLQLDPGLTEADLAAIGCSGHCLTIARALQTYGMYVIDNSRRPKVMLEFEGTAGWSGAVTASTVSPIPLTAFRLLQY